MNCQNRKQWSIVSILNTTYVETSDQLIPTYIVIFGIKWILPGSLLHKQQKFMINMYKIYDWIINVAILLWANMVPTGTIE